ncbi:MAG TPA: EAL domain-containing protein [Acidimicrobiales bacterium]|nr:EAL domain-containing protein [Acidimicrobiales bacterium]
MAGSDRDERVLFEMLLDRGRMGRLAQRGRGVIAGLDDGPSERFDEAMDDAVAEMLAHERAVLDALAEGVIVQSPGGRVVRINERALELLACRQEDVVGRPMPPAGSRWRDGAGRALRAAELPSSRAVLERGAVGPLRVEIHHLDGTTSVEMTARPLVRDGELEPYAVVTTLQPVEALPSIAPGEDTLARFRLGFEHGSTGMAMTDPGGRLALANPALEKLLGKTEDELVGQKLADFAHPHDRAGCLELMHSLLAGPNDAGRIERRFVRADGVVWWGATDACVVRSADGVPQWVFWQVQDVTERRRQQAALDYHIAHDPLTGLANRLGLEQHLEEAFERATRHRRRIAVCFLDLDRFTFVNEGLGHLAGDQLLVDVADRLTSAAPAGSFAARFGGDEFVVVVEDLESAEGATEVGEQLVALFAEPFYVGSEELGVTASCGVSLASPNGGTEKALRDADVALSLAKRRGGGRAEVFDPSLGRVVADRFGIERALRFALQRDQLRLYFQPIVELAHGRIAGVEGLLRWEHPGQGLLEPSEFIPAAEESRLIHEIGAFVVEEGLRQVVRWRKALPGCEELWVAVNLSTRQLSGGDPVALCASALKTSGADPKALRLELTESAVMEDFDASIGLLRRLRDLGIDLAIDDFGTGYSSLSYLSKLPVRSLKVDRSFIAGVTDDDGDSEIVRAIIALARTMHLELCAEGIERLDQVAMLAELGCDLGQGYLWAPPLDATEFERWMRGPGLDMRLG